MKKEQFEDIKDLLITITWAICLSAGALIAIGIKLVT